MSQLISIISPVFNRADLLQATAESVLAQTWQNWEWIIVDDGSADNTVDYCKRLYLKEQRVRFFERNTEPKGACACRNIGLQKSEGEFVIFLDSDDLLAPFCLEQRIAAFNNKPNLDFLVFPQLLFKETPGDHNYYWNVDKEIDDLDRFLSGDGVWPISGPIWRSNSIKDSLAWNQKLTIWQDVDFHIRALLQGMKYEKVSVVKPDIFIRKQDSSLSRTGYNNLPQFISRLEVFKNTFDKLWSEGQVEKHKNGLRKMFFQLFVTAANLKYWNSVKWLMGRASRSTLFTEQELRTFGKYFLHRRVWLYKLKSVNASMMQMMSAIESTPDITLGKVALHE